MLKTVAGGTLTATLNGPNNVVIKDESGNSANITVYDVMQVECRDPRDRSSIATEDLTQTRHCKCVREVRITLV